MNNVDITDLCNMTITKLKFLGKNNRLEDCGYTLAEQIKIYDEQLEELFKNPREFLDSLDFVKTYRVSWKDYRDHTPTLPFAHVKKKRVYK